MKNPVLAGLIAVGSAFAIVLTAAFWVHEHLPQVSDGLFGILVAVALVSVAFGLMALLYKGPWLEWRANTSGLWPSRLPKAKPLPFEQDWLLAELAYLADLAAVATCVHLQPFERAMRQMGIETRLVTQPWRAYSPFPKIRATCCVNEIELKRRFSLPPQALFREGYDSERSVNDIGWADMICDECGSRIEVIHSERGSAQTPWFPAEPS